MPNIEVWKNMWNSRYAEREYAYGIEPNEYLKEQLQKLEPGSVLFGAEGEGRNAVYAATLGWNVSAFDISDEGKNKAQLLAKQQNVEIDYKVGLLPDLAYGEGQFDALAFTYAHFPADLRSQYYELLDSYLKKGGIVIFEAFGPKNLEYRKDNPKIGGPQDVALLYSVDDLKSYFKGYEIIELAEMEVELKEGLYHNGKGSVTRFVGRKK